MIDAVLAAAAHLVQALAAIPSVIADSPVYFTGLAVFLAAVALLPDRDPR